jgi:hypothetical protein
LEGANSAIGGVAAQEMFVCSTHRLDFIPPSRRFACHPSLLERKL